MQPTQRAFLDELLETASPSGFETAAQKAWIDYVSEYADEVRTDEYGNAVAVLDGEEPAVALAGHSDEIGYMVRDIGEDGSVRITAIGGSDKTVSQGQHVRIHTDEGTVAGVIGQTAIHLRDRDADETADINEQHIDIGTTDSEETADLLERGDPVTIEQTVTDLENRRIAARGLDNRVGIWAAAEGFRRAAEADPTATVYAISTVQEELGLRGARMVGFDLDLDAVIATDVTHATDDPGAPGSKSSNVELGGGPSVARGSANHPNVVKAVRDVANTEGIEIQLEATASRTGTDADAFYTASGGTPSLNVGIPNRYMHTPVETLDLSDLDATAELLGQFAARADAYEFGIEF